MSGQRDGLARVLGEHHWGDDTALVGTHAVQCGCGWKATDRDIYALRARHDQHRADALTSAGFGPVRAVEEERDAAGLTVDEREALERHLGGGMAGYVRRIRSAHGPHFNGSTYTGCRCGEVACPYPRLIVHMDDLIRAYEMKVQDFAKETRRASEATARAESAEAALAGVVAGVEAFIAARDNENWRGWGIPQGLRALLTFTSDHKEDQP